MSRPHIILCICKSLSLLQRSGESHKCGARGGGTACFCSESRCCSEYAWCGSSSSHCKENDNKEWCEPIAIFFLKSLPLSDLALAKRILLPRGKKGDHKAIEEQCENHPTALPTATFQPSTIPTNIRNPSPKPPRDIPCDNTGYVFCIIAGVLCALMAARITQQAAKSSQLSTIRFASSAGSVVAMLIGFSLLGEFKYSMPQRNSANVAYIGQLCILRDWVCLEFFHALLEGQRRPER